MQTTQYQSDSDLSAEGQTLRLFINYLEQDHDKMITYTSFNKKTKVKAGETEVEFVSQQL